MLNEKWMITDGVSNTGESSETVAARVYNKNVMVAYMAYGGIKIIELSGVSDFCGKENVNVTDAEISEQVGDDYEVLLPVVIEGSNVVLIVDSMDSLTVVGGTVSTVPTVVSSEDYASDEIELAIEDNPAYDGLMDVMEL